MLACIPAIDLFVKERTDDKERNTAGEKNIRNSLTEKLKERFSFTEKGEGFRTLLCDLEQWMSHSRGQMMNHPRRQVLSGHDSFDEYLHHMQSRPGTLTPIMLVSRSMEPGV